MDRHNHYEAAFAAFLRERRVCHIAIDETRRSFLGDAPAKSLDFIVHGQCGERFVVDVKGRRYPGGSAQRPKYTWESWVTRDDVEDAQYWAAKFGVGYRALFVFSYYLVPPIKPIHEPHLCWHWQQKDYLLRAIRVDEYVRAMKVRSPKWRTVHLPLADYRRLVKPLHDFLIELHWSRTEPSLSVTG